MSTVYVIDMSDTAKRQLTNLAQDQGLAKRYKAVVKALKRLSENPRHPALHSHQWQGDPCPHNRPMWEAYAENRTSGAYRIFFCYCPVGQKTIHIIHIVTHP